MDFLDMTAISPFVELPFLHFTPFQWAANHRCSPAHMVSTWPKLGQSDCLFHKFGFWVERDRGGGKRVGIEPSNDHSQRAAEIPEAAIGPFQKVMFSTLSFCGLNSILAKSYLPQPELLSEAWNQRQWMLLQFRDGRTYFQLEWCWGTV